MALFSPGSKLGFKNKFTEEEKELIDDFVFKTQNNLEKENFNVFFKPDRYIDRPSYPREPYITETIGYDLLYKNKKVSECAFYKIFEDNIISENIVKILVILNGKEETSVFHRSGIRIKYGRVGITGFRIEFNENLPDYKYDRQYGIEDVKEYFDIMSNRLVKYVIAVIKNRSKKK